MKNAVLFKWIHRVRGLDRTRGSWKTWVCCHYGIKSGMTSKVCTSISIAECGTLDMSDSISMRFHIYGIFTWISTMHGLVLSVLPSAWRHNCPNRAAAFECYGTEGSRGPRKINVMIAMRIFRVCLLKVSLFTLTKKYVNIISHVFECFEKLTNISTCHWKEIWQCRSFDWFWDDLKSITYQ